jgi:hypothetical protein
LDKIICLKKKEKKEGEFFWENVFIKKSSSVNFTNFVKILEIFNIKKTEKKKPHFEYIKIKIWPNFWFLN